MVTNRLKSKEETPFKSLFEGLCHIINNEGFRALWYGVVPSLILVSNPVIHFTIYQGLKRRINVTSATGFFLLGKNFSFESHLHSCNICLCDVVVLCCWVSVPLQ